jgi:NAD(P)H-flavin reductase
MTDEPSWDGESRRIDTGFLRDHLGQDLASYRYLVAGPPAMVESIVETLAEADVPEERISADRFSGY